MAGSSPDLAVGDDVTAAANLAARTTVGARPGFVQTHIAFAAHSHAKCAVAKHLDAHLVAGEDRRTSFFTIASCTAFTWSMLSSRASTCTSAHWA